MERRRPDSANSLSAATHVGRCPRVHCREGALRDAFTVIELLVVVAIIGVLSGLLAAAVQRVREAANRVKCTNNLRQLGTALQHFHDTYGALPPGCSFSGPAEPQPHMSWMTRLLPYVEQDAIWQAAVAAYQQAKFFEDVPHQSILGKSIPAFLCPSDSLSSRPWSFGWFSAAFTDYLGVEGTDLRAQGGVLFLNSRIRLADVTDGSSNTLAVGERPPSADHHFGWWYAGWGQLRTGSADMVIGVRELCVHPKYRSCPAGPYDFGPGRADDRCAAFHFWSFHPGGANFLFADGSVRFLTYSADPIMPALATRTGGEFASMPE